ncbi:MAG: helix-hairpin-helix domain-containing protein [Candidatus Omnitrophica bacterium]|nr:helix-hairpin-helix domain-containing protein [Candidatus Omnitrophota bacterium]
MLILTNQEKQVILFLSVLALAGIMISFLAKINSRVEGAIRVEDKLIKIDLNKAGMEELMATRAVSEKLSQKIIQYRQEHGEFKNIEEIKEVKGVGENRFAKLKELFFVE